MRLQATASARGEEGGAAGRPPAGRAAAGRPAAGGSADVAMADADGDDDLDEGGALPARPSAMGPPPPAPRRGRGAATPATGVPPEKARSEIII